MLGAHEGTYGFTIGQRKGLRIGRPAPDGKPRFVLDIEPVSGTVTVGPRERLAVDRLTGIRPRWCGTVPGERPRAPSSCARTATSTGAVVRGGRRRASTIELLDPAYGIAPGQAAVIYDGTRVVGSATIARRTAARSRRMTRRDRRRVMPGDDQHAYDEALRLVLGELPDLPHLPEVPGRGRGRRR